MPTSWIFTKFVPIQKPPKIPKTSKTTEKIMKRTKSHLARILSVNLGIAALAIATASRADAVLIDFNTSGQLTTGFTQRNQLDGADTIFQESPTGGISNSGDVTHIVGGTNDGTAIYDDQAFDLTTNAQFTVSMFFKPLSASGAPALQVGFTDAATHGFAANTNDAFLSVRIVGNGSTNWNFQTQTKNAGTTTATAVTLAGGSNIALSTSNFYKLSGAFTRTATANTFNYTFTLENYGTTGAGVPSTVFTLNGSLSNSTLYSDTAVNGAFRSGEGAANNFDNFAVVPEPRTIAMRVGGFGCLFAFQRRRRRLG